MEEFLSTPQGIWTAVGVGLALAVLFVVVKRLLVKERQHLSHLAGALNSAGVPEEFTTPISDLAAGDGPAAIGAIIKAAKDLRSTAGWLSLVKGVFTAAMADPARKAALSQLLTDLQAGASDATLTTDLGAAYSANPLSKVIGTGPLATDLAHVSARLQILKQNPALASLASTFGNLPQHLQTTLTGLLDAAHTIGSDARAVAPGVLAATAAVVPMAAPVALPVAAAVAAANMITIPDGHQAVISPIPRTTAASAV